MGGKTRTEKMSVTLPKELANEIRSIASKGEISSFFTEALEHYIAYHKQKTALAKGFGAWKDNNHPGLATPKDSSAYVRAIREAGRERKQRLEGTSAK
ncbi:MAG: ribbon-helix-helix domain-containing protein [Dehalococcoidia bacterium]